MFSELSVQVIWASIFVLLQFGFLKDVSELLANQVLLLLVKDIDTFLSIVEPWMVKHLFRSQSLGNVLFEHVLHEVSGQFRHCVSILNLLLVELMCQITDLIRFKWHIAIKYGVEADTCRPDIDWEPLISNLLHNLRRNVSWSATLLKKKLVLIDSSADSKIANFYISVAIEQDIVKLDISMNYSNRMHVSNSLHDLFEEVLGVFLS